MRWPIEANYVDAHSASVVGFDFSELLGCRPLPRSGNAVLFYGKDGDLTGPDREHAEISVLALHLLQSALVRATTLFCSTSSTARAGANCGARRIDEQ